MADRNEHDEFYVGYLPMPPRHLRFVRVLVTMLGLWIIGMGGVIALSMRDPGDAVWDTSREQAWAGTLLAEPYPMLVPHDGSEPSLIVEMGKRGAQPRVAPLAGQAVEVRGFLLSRYGRRIIELSPDDTALKPIDMRPPPIEGERVIGPVTLEGEIVDGKCYLGAMKPGDGMTHKACATLCVRGGLPPMIVSSGVNGPEFRLLVIEGHAGMPESLVPLIAEPVRVEGRLVEVGGLRFVRAPEPGVGRMP